MGPACTPARLPRARHPWTARMSGHVPAGTWRSAALAEVYADQGKTANVLVVDGHGLRVCVERGHLILSDGLGAHRRERRISRANRTVRRIAILGHSGH